MAGFAPNISIAPKSHNTASVNSSLGGRFGALASSDPYQNLPRDRTFWDKVVNFFGFRSGYDRAQEQYNLASAEYQAQLAQLASEEQYNSPSAQAMRMREAGFNPDLNGLGDVSPASEFDNQQASPDVSADVELGSVVSTVLSAFTGTMSILKDMRSLKQMNQAIDANDIQLGNSLLDFFKNSHGLFDQYDFDADLKDSVQGYHEDSIISSLFGSQRNRKRFSELRKTAENSLYEIIADNETFDKYYDSQESVSMHKAQPYHTGVQRRFEDTQYQLLRPLAEATYNEAIHQANRLIAEHKLAEKNASTEENVLYGEGSTLGEDVIREGAKAGVSSAGWTQSSSSMMVSSARIYRSMLNALHKQNTVGAKIMELMIASKLLKLQSPSQDVSNLAGAASAVAGLVK